jgi:hypothetical protein
MWAAVVSQVIQNTGKRPMIWFLARVAATVPCFKGAKHFDVCLPPQGL